MPQQLSVSRIIRNSLNSLITTEAVSSEELTTTTDHQSGDIV